MKRLPGWTLLLPLLAIAVAAPAPAVVVSYRAQDLPDGVVGEDRWQYRYALDEFPYDAGWGFTVYFDPDLYADLEPAPPIPDPTWDALGFEPDPNLGEPGFYDAEALADSPATGAIFTIAFRWLGEGAPGPQPFEVREPSYAVVESGTTVLPEASGAGLGAGALAALAALRRSAA